MGEEVLAVIQDMGMHNEKQISKQNWTCYHSSRCLKLGAPAEGQS